MTQTSPRPARPPAKAVPDDLRDAPPVGGGAFRPHEAAHDLRARDRSAHRALMGLWEDLE